MRLLRVPKKTMAKVAVFGLFSLVMTLALAVKIGNIRLFAHTYTVSAQFADASGVFKGDAVKLAGVDVGRVQGTKIDHGLAVVTFNVDKDVKLTTDSLVAIRWRNVLGQRFLYVFPGDGKGRQLKDGALIPVSRTEDAGDLNAFLNKLGPILQAIDPDKANAFLDSVNQALSGNEVAVRSLLGDAATLSGKLGNMDQQIKDLISSSDTVMSTYAAQNQSISQILDDLNSVGGRVQGMTSDINTFITDFADVQQQLDKLMTSQKSNIDFDLQALNSVSGTLEKNKGTLATTLCSLPAGVAGYFQTTSWGEWFNVRIVKFEIKDNRGNVITSASELPGSRSGKNPNPDYSCQGSPTVAQSKAGSTGQGSAGGGSKTGGVGGGKASLPKVPKPPDPGFQSLQELIQNILGGSRRG